MGFSLLGKDGKGLLILATITGKKAHLKTVGVKVKLAFSRVGKKRFFHKLQTVTLSLVFRTLVR
jgi:hypothetical protein